MVELVLNFILKLVGLGLGYYVVYNISSKKAKDFHMTVNHNGLEIDSTFYEE